jgi:hypothetical protein
MRRRVKWSRRSIVYLKFLCAVTIVAILHDHILTQAAVKCYRGTSFYSSSRHNKKDPEVTQIIEAILTSARLFVHRRTRYKTEIQESCNHWSNPVMAHCPVALYLLYLSYVSRSTWASLWVRKIWRPVHLKNGSRISLSSLKEICMYVIISIMYRLTFLCV